MSTHYTNLILFVLSILFYAPAYAQCPITPCAENSSIIHTNDIPDCKGDASKQYDGNLNNNSDCEDANKANCWKFTFFQDDPIISGLSMDIGKGDGCNGQVDVCYSLVDGICVDHGTTGSQNHMDTDFGVNGKIDIWVCDNSSGNVSLCVCAESLAPAPVDLASFASAVSGHEVILSWTTASERNNQLFVIQRSSDGKQFEKIGAVNGRGTTSFKQSYFYIDRQPLAKAYYRLKQIDFDENYEYSNVIYQERKTSPSLINIFPTQSNDQINLVIEADGSQKSALKVVHVSGEVYLHKTYSEETGVKFIELDVSNYAPGIYFVSLINKTGMTTGSFIASKE